ncbi:MAG: toll/interleukin-1 receptor domain-containing protein [Rhodocyclales bacterium]|nr:toll/interleukin-1 receptor domain-containing protein [Rhodocyclales bacterium]
MGFKHACFVSYRHSDKEKTIKFIEQLVDALDNCFDQYVPLTTYHDKLRLLPGYKFKEAIEQALRDSVCLVAILSNEYFESEYCRREYSAMKRIEDERRNQLGLPPIDRGLIIPILVWTSEEDVPDAIKDEIHFDPMQFSLTNLRGEIKYDPNLIPVVQRIADIIIDLYRAFHKGGCCQNAVDCCQAIGLPSANEVKAMWSPPQWNPQPLPSRVDTGAPR